jgi:hypothetical protein
MTFVKKTGKQAMPEDVAALRATLESRLHALEEALANPAKHGSLESLILELARVATEEADATARQAFLDGQRDGQAALASARTQVSSAIEAERTAAATLRQAADKAQAELEEERRAAEAAQRDLAGARRELDALRQSIEHDESGRAAVRRELEAALASIDIERARAASFERTASEVRRDTLAERTALEAQQRDVAARLQEFASRHQALEQQLRDEQAAYAALRHEMDQARGVAEVERSSVSQLLDRSGQLERDLEAARGELSEREQAIQLAQEETRAAGARAEEALGERDALRSELQTAREERDAARAAHEERDAAGSVFPTLVDEVEDEETVVDLTIDTKEEELQRAIEIRIRSLELALRDAEMRAESAEVELDLQRRSTSPAPEEAEPPPSPSAQEPSKEFRGPARGARRIAMTSEVDIQIDGTPAKLVDLSTTGAQVLTRAAMKPNHLVKVMLQTDEGPSASKAKVMWSRLEPRSGQLWYRAGVAFISADQFVLDAILARHRREA